MAGTVIKLTRKPRRRRVGAKEGTPGKVEVAMLPGAERAEDALKYVHALLSRDPPVKGILVVEVDATAVASVRVFGPVTRADVVWAATQLVDSALHD